eukprot:13095505-Ditylum_brightwellii.AAC.1
MFPVPVGSGVYVYRRQVGRDQGLALIATPTYTLVLLLCVEHVLVSLVADVEICVVHLGYIPALTSQLFFIYSSMPGRYRKATYQSNQ